MIKHIFTHKRAAYPALASIFIAVALLVTACGQSNVSTPPVSASPPAVNGFGIAANHVHSLLALPTKVLVLATHYGIYRTENAGANWSQVSGGPNQLMDGLMEYALAVSPINPQRLYVATQVSVRGHSGTLGLYTSGDQGKTWKLSIPTSSLTSNPNGIYTIAAGDDTPDEVYIYLPDLGALGLKVSLDDGQHFSSVGTLPFGRIYRILAIPGQPGHLLICGSDGIAGSSDGGAHWQVLKSVNGGVDEMATPGPHSPIYASGDLGIYVSANEGQSFTLVNGQASFNSLSVSLARPQVLYGKTGTAIYHSLDGGHTWSQLPHINGVLQNLAVDPANASQVYLALSYPTKVYSLTQGSTGWSSLTPPA
jgi:photosystem II stability/assembly factor-like uncharacterized protein